MDLSFLVVFASRLCYAVQDWVQDGVVMDGLWTRTRMSNDVTSTGYEHGAKNTIWMSIDLLLTYCSFLILLSDAAFIRFRLVSTGPSCA